MKIEGGCLCGQVRYSAEAEPVFVGLCHCRNCQKSTGSAFRVAVAIPAETLAIEGTVKTYDDHGDTGEILHRSFCPNCGSSIVNNGASLAGVSIIGAGTLDDSSWVRPALEIYCDRAQSWVDLAGDRRKWPEAPQFA